MLDRAKRLAIMVASNRRSLEEVDGSLEALETGQAERTSYSTLKRAFHTIKHDAAHLQLERLSRLAAAAEAIVERAKDQKLGLPLDLLRRASEEIRKATEKVAAGGRHRLDRSLLASLEQEARPAPADGPRRSST